MPSPVLKTEAKHVWHTVVSLSPELKIIYFQDAIHDSQGDSSKLWKIHKKFLQNREYKDEILSINGKESLQNMVEELNGLLRIEVLWTRARSI